MRWAARLRKRSRKRFFPFAACRTRTPGRRISGAHERRFRPWYLAQKQPDDLVVSASPEFLLAPACRRQAGYPPAHRLPCRCAHRALRASTAGEREKVSRFREQYPDAEIGQFYSDSRSDAPLAHRHAVPFWSGEILTPHGRCNAPFPARLRQIFSAQQKRALSRPTGRFRARFSI